MLLLLVLFCILVMTWSQLACLLDGRRYQVVVVVEYLIFLQCKGCYVPALKKIHGAPPRALLLLHIGDHDDDDGFDKSQTNGIATRRVGKREREREIWELNKCNRITCPDCLPSMSLSLTLLRFSII